MTFYCKNICTRYRATKPTGIGRYSVGQKRCNVCFIFIFWDGVRCPCCSNKLRITPRSRFYKEKMKEEKCFVTK